MKTISFVMPCFNDGDSIEKAINSIRDQDLPDIEIVVVNDGSTDNSKLVLDALKEQGKIDTLIHLEKNSGACVARNTGTKAATGKYLSFLPADAILYPGVARIWYETLEDNPDYDFLYGGYRFIDEDGEPIPGNDLFFQPLEPYLLEVSNYIDGSFPIKTESFWKFAKIMNQPDGLWDPNVKSLQDWDFWLSVVKNGGKGVYVQDIFFGTTMPHPGGLSYDSSANWVKRTDFIKDKHKIPHRKLCVASLGAAWHAKRLAYMLNADFKEMPSFKAHNYDAIYVIGFYPEFATQQDSMFLNSYYDPAAGRVSSKKVVHFVGTDVWQLYQTSLMSLKIWQNYMKNNIDVVLCESDFIQAELKELGIPAEIVPIPPLKLFDMKPLPKDFVVACYQPQVNSNFYRPAEMREIAKAMPDVKFKFFGDPRNVGTDKDIANIEHCGYVDNMEGFIEECSAIMRFPLHDGLPISVLEFILAGRHAIASVPIRHALCLTEFKLNEAVEGIKRLKDMCVEQNKVGSDYWRVELDHEKFKSTIKKYTDYDPKDYWEKRASEWQKQSSFELFERPEHNERAKKNFEIDSASIKALITKIAPKSVIDLGCGDGRWYPILKELGVEDYKGIDISENLIKAAQFRFPHEKDNFKTLKVEDLSETSDKADLVFSYTCFEHIKEEDWDKAIAAVKKVGKKLLLVEPTNFASQYYCRSHDYEKDFKVIEKIQLSDKVVLLCDLQDSAS